MADSTKYSAGAMALLKANLGFYGTDAPAELVSYWGSLLEYSHDAFADMGIPLQPGTLADDRDFCQKQDQPQAGILEYSESQRTG